MKIELSTNQAIDMLLADTNANWSYNGARALVEYLEHLEEDLGEDLNFNVVDLRCEYSEYPSLQEAGSQYDIASDEDEASRDYSIKELKYFQDNTTLLEFEGGVIIRDF